MVSDQIWDDIRPKGSSIPASLAIIALCIIVSIGMAIDPWAVRGYLSLNPALVESRPWTLVTHIFVHADIGHLFWNMLALFFFGTELERRVGERNFLLVFFASGIFGGIIEMLVATGYMMGASGAIMGVMGALAIIAPEIRVIIFPIPIPLGIPLAIALLAFLDLYYQISLRGADGIGHMAHLAGLLAGLFLGQSFGRRRRYY